MLGILLIAADVIFYIALFDLYWDFITCQSKFISLMRTDQVIRLQVYRIYYHRFFLGFIFIPLSPNPSDAKSIEGFGF